MGFRPGSFLGSVARLSSGNAVGMVIALAAYPVLTRLYTKQDFGIVGLAASFYSVAAVAATLSYEFSIVSAETDEDAAGITAGGTLCALLVSVLSFFALWWFIAAGCLGFEQLTWTFVVPIGLCTLVQAVGTMFRYYQLRQEDYRGLTVLPVVQNGSRVGVQLGWGWASPSGMGLLIGELVSRGWMAVYSYRCSRERFTSALGALSLGGIFRILQKYRRFPFVIMPSSLLNAAALSIQVPIVAQTFGLAVAGSFTIAKAAFAMPLKILGTSIADVFHRRISGADGGADSDVLSLFIKTSAILMVMVLPCCVLLMIWGGDLFALVFGADWRSAGDVAGLITPWALGQFVVGSVSRTVFVIDMKGLKLIYDFTALALTFVIPYLASQTSLGAGEIIGVYASLSALTYGFYYLLMLVLIYRSQARALDAAATAHD